MARLYAGPACHSGYDGAFFSAAAVSLTPFLAPGIEPGDLPALHPLLQAQELLAAFVTLFRGGRDEVLVRLLVLREIGARAEAPCWTPAELSQQFAYLDPIKLDTVLHRLREHQLLLWDADARHYQLSRAGRTALAALDSLLQFGDDDDAELGYITAQVAAAGSSRVSADVLRHLLARLTELEQTMQQAMVSGSEQRIRAAQAKLQAVWQWIEKGSRILRDITRDGELDSASHRIAQRIGQAQARLLRSSSLFARALAQLEQQRVHLGQSGLSSGDILGWLRRCSVDQLAALAESAVTAQPQPLFIAPAEMCDLAEHQLAAAGAPIDAGLPAPMAAPEITDPGTLHLPELQQFSAELAALDAAIPLADAVVGGDYPQAAYRLSLLALLGDAQTTGNGPLAELARLNLAVTVQDQQVAVDRAGVAEISQGTIKPK